MYLASSGRRTFEYTLERGLNKRRLTSDLTIALNTATPYLLEIPKTTPPIMQYRTFIAFIQAPQGHPKTTGPNADAMLRRRK